VTLPVLANLHVRDLAGHPSLSRIMNCYPVTNLKVISTTCIKRTVILWILCWLYCHYSCYWSI